MINQKINIGITGGTGTLGKILIKKLKQKNYKLFLYRSDIRNFRSIKKWIINNKLDVIFHLASVVSVKNCNQNPLVTCSTNIGGTINILNSFRFSKKKIWFFYASTSHVYKIKKKPLTEKDPIVPRSFYGYTKWIGELMIESACKELNIPFCIGRIFSFYSDTQSSDFLYPSIKKKIKENINHEPIYIANAHNVLDIQKAENVIKILIKLFEKKSEGIYNIGSGKGIKIKNFAKNLTKKKIKIITNSNKKNIVLANIAKIKSTINM